LFPLPFPRYVNGKFWEENFDGKRKEGVVKDTNILATFRMTPQLGVPPEEAGAAVAAESSTSTWTTVWTDGLSSLDRYKGRCYNIKPVVGEENEYIAYVAYPLDLFMTNFSFASGKSKGNLSHSKI